MTHPHATFWCSLQYVTIPSSLFFFMSYLVTTQHNTTHVECGSNCSSSGRVVQECAVPTLLHGVCLMWEIKLWTRTALEPLCAFNQVDVAAEFTYFFFHSAEVCLYTGTSTIIPPPTFGSLISFTTYGSSSWATHQPDTRIYVVICSNTLKCCYISTVSVNRLLFLLEARPYT
jgi:hypothetical protein